MENTLTTPTTAKTYFSRDLYQEVTNTIIEQLEAGTIPWQMSWTGGSNASFLRLPKNFSTNKYYQGINIVLLWSASLKHGFTSSEWGTFKQWSAKKESIRKNEKGSMIVYYDTFEKEIDGEIQRIPFLKASVVFNRCQLASYKPEAAPVIVASPASAPVETIAIIDAFVTATKADIIHNGNNPRYLPARDIIEMPLTTSFTATQYCTASENYYATLLHELVHWSGNPNRMNRVKGKRFGDQQYAFEEMVAELGAAFLCADFKLSTTQSGDHASYIAHWLGVLKDNKHFIVTAASEASKAVGYLKGLQVE
ncbi:MAG: zincin-like metallopeptidase domain-containing protein [Phycisphaerales bacterium]|nr:zincin-like metallopeptidase domain-containing protein [Phycisphaerales bacterium]